MKLSKLAQLIDMAYRSWGDIECGIDIDGEDGTIYDLEDVIGYSDEDNDFMLLLTAYTTQVKLSLVR